MNVFNSRTVVFVSLIILLGGPLLAQESTEPWCGTREISPWLTQWYSKHRKSAAQRSADTSWLFVPCTFHILGNDVGVGYYSADQIFRAVCEMNRQFEKSRIHFYLKPGDPIRYINKTKWYSHDYDGGRELIESNLLPDRMNAFVVQNPAGACGYSWLDAIVLGKNCSGAGNATWAHEAGHHLSLPHPFYGWEDYKHNYALPAPLEIDNRPVEKMDGSNCYESGDLFCDTRPDYLNFRWTCNGSRESTQLQHDPDGVAFRSDGALMMGYANDACRARFTEEQIAAMRENLRTEHQSYLQISQPLPQIPDDAKAVPVSPVDSQQVQYDKAVFEWQPVENAGFYTVEISRYPNFSIVAYRGTVYKNNRFEYTGPLVNNYVLYWRVKSYGEDDLCQPNSQLPVGIFRTANLNAGVSSAHDLSQWITAELNPNPVASGQSAQIVLQSAVAFEGQIQVQDAAGRLCRQSPVSVAQGDNIIPVATESLPPGLYAVSIVRAGARVSLRMAIQ